MDLTEVEEVARIHRRTIENRSNDPDNHDRVITHLDPDVLDWEVKWETLEISSRKLEISREHFMQRWAR